MRYIIILIALVSYKSMDAQCHPDRHSTSWNDAWYSCEESPNPNSQRNEGHWIMYDLRHEYKLGQGKLWNVNAPERLQDGFANFFVDYSKDGENWESLGEFNAPMGTGSPFYEGEDIFNFSGDTARFVLFTAITNHGGDCFGISEMKIDVVDITLDGNNSDDECLHVNVFPNPHKSSFNIDAGSFCAGPIYYQLFNSNGSKLREGQLPEQGVQNFEINTVSYSSGVYYLVVIQNGNSKQIPIVKIHN
ncbi:MAG: T9SS type A sorting domain-containing protein [Bacteroidota bacterium]